MQTKPVTQGAVLKDITFDNCRIVETRHAPNVFYDFHAHKESTITFTINGSFTEEFCGNTFHCNMFDLLYKPGGTEHRNSYNQSGTHSLLIEFFDHDNSLKQYEGKGIFIRSVQKEFAKNIAIKLYAFLSSGNELVTLAADELLSEFSRVDVHTQCEKQIPPWLKRTKEYLDENIFEKVSLSQLSKMANVHHVYYARCFRRFFGRSVSQYLHKKRLAEAMMKLQHEDKTNVQLANDFGYTDQSHFTHFFKRETGFTPNVFSKKFRSYN